MTADVKDLLTLGTIEARETIYALEALEGLRALSVYRLRNLLQAIEQERIAKETT